MFKNLYADQIGMAVVAMLGGLGADKSYTTQPGEGHFRQAERLAKHRTQWNDTPVNDVISRQVRRAYARRALKAPV